jgi:hypothetical protein
MHQSMRLLLFNGYSVQQPLQLTPRYRQCGTRLYRPFKSASLEPSIVKPKSIGVPSENFQFIFLTVAKYKPSIRKGIQIKYSCHQSGQSVDGFPQICWAGGQIYLLDGFGIQHDAPRVRSRSVKSAESNPGLISMVIFPTRKWIPHASLSPICRGIHGTLLLFSLFRLLYKPGFRHQ